MSWFVLIGRISFCHLSNIEKHFVSRHFLSTWLRLVTVVLSTPTPVFIYICTPNKPLQREAETASVDSVMAEDHAVLLKSVKKSKSDAAPVEMRRLWSSTLFVFRSSSSDKEKRDSQIQFRRWKCPGEDEKGTASFLLFNTYKYRREWKKTENELVMLMIMISLTCPPTVLSLKGRIAKKPTTSKRAKAAGVCVQSASVRRYVLQSTPEASNRRLFVPWCLC